MASTTAAAPVRTPARRLRLFAPFFGASAVLALFSLSQVWYSASMYGATVLGVTNVTARVSLTGNQLAALSSQASTLTASAPHPPTQFGVLAPVFWLAVAAICGVLASWLVSRLFGVLGAALSLYAWQALASTRAQIEQPKTWGQFTVVRGAGQSYLWLAMTVTIIGLVLVTIQAHIAKRHEKAHDPEAPATTPLSEILNKVLRTSARNLLASSMTPETSDPLVKH